MGPAAMSGAGSPADQTDRNRPSDQRFRSFAERYFIERARLLVDDGEIDKQFWKVIQQAKTAYKMIRSVGINVHEEGV